MDISIRSDLDRLKRDLSDLEKKLLPQAVARGIQGTLKGAQSLAQSKLNKQIDKGPANKFISDRSVAYEIGKGKSLTSSNFKTNRNTALDSLNSSNSARIFINEIQAEVLKPSLEGETKTKIDHPSSNSFSDLYYIPANLKKYFIAGDSDKRKLILKLNRKGNVTGLKKGAIKRLKAEARGRSKKYFEVTRVTRTPSGRTLYPGIYRRERKGLKSTLFMVLGYQRVRKYKKFNYNFEQIVINDINKSLFRNIDKALERELKKLGND